MRSFFWQEKAPPSANAEFWSFFYFRKCGKKTNLSAAGLELGILFLPSTALLTTLSLLLRRLASKELI